MIVMSIAFGIKQCDMLNIIILTILDHAPFYIIITVMLFFFYYE